VAFAIFVACKVPSPASSSIPQDPIPSQPSWLTARAVSSDQIDLSWGKSTDDNGTPYYRIIRNNSFLQNVNGTKLSDTGLNPETQYCYHVIAYDSDGNISHPSPEACTVSSWIISNTELENKGLGDTDVLSPPSIAVDSSGRVIYGYTWGYYKYATKTQSGWVVEQPGIGGRLSAMAIDSSDNAHISYDGPGNYLSYSTNSSGTWETEIIDNTLSVTFTSIAVDSADYIHISYTGMFNGVRTIKYATNASGNWMTEILESSNSIDYRSPSPIAVDLNGDVHVSFISYDSNDGSILRYITNASGTWSTDIIDIIQGGFYPNSSIAVDSAGNVNIIYNSNYSLKYATNSSGVWISETVDSSLPSNPHFSLAVDSYGNSHVSYLDSSYLNESLRYAKNVSGVWENYIIDDAGVEVAPTSIAIDDDDKVHIIYNYSFGLRYVTNR
jgi:hypothetical protein